MFVLPSFVDEAYSLLYTLCLEGMGLGTPNPNVSASIYSPEGQLISRGFHTRKSSLDHAEVVAIKAAGPQARGATIVVSLEPCAHFGSTPPCTQAIIDAGITRVIYAVKDPNPIAAGGAQKLLDAGIDVLFHESVELTFAQRAWLHKSATGRPLMIWKVATTVDGKVAAIDGSSQWITSSQSRDDVQILRAQSDAIVIGTNTAIVDNPHLIPRGHIARPVRIICGEQEVPSTNQIFDDQARTVVVKSKSIPNLIELLCKENFNQVLVEAGPTFGSALMKSGCIDELVIYQAPKILGAGKDFVSDLGITTLADHRTLDLISVERIGSDIKSHYRVEGK